MDSALPPLHAGTEESTTENSSGPEPMQLDFVRYVGHAQSLNNAQRLNALLDHFKPDKYQFVWSTESSRHLDSTGLINMTG